VNGWVDESFNSVSTTATQKRQKAKKQSNKGGKEMHTPGWCCGGGGQSKRPAFALAWAAWALSSGYQ